MHFQNNVSLLPYNTFRIQARARYYAEICSEEDLLSALYSWPSDRGQLLVLGGGSNMLFTHDYEGLVIRIAIEGISEVIYGNDVFVTAGAGVVWNDLVLYCVSKNYAGLENLSLIPGTTGASPVQNIGAYGVEIKDVFDQLTAYDRETNTFKKFNSSECEFAYRSSVFKTYGAGRYIITSVCFKLSLVAKPNTSYGAIASVLKSEGIGVPSIADISRIVSRIRVEKLPDPSMIGNAGSFFKNPVISKERFSSLLHDFPSIVHYPAANDSVKIAAGWLIEYCGFKGLISGHTGTWKNQALVLVNHGGATGLEIIRFAREIMAKVNSIFGLEIETEVNIL